MTRFHVINERNLRYARRPAAVEPPEIGHLLVGSIFQLFDKSDLEFETGFEAGGLAHH